jgi:hypothetical protein
MDHDATTIHHRGKHTVIEVDTRNATYRGIAWHDLGAFGKRKFDNRVFIRNARNMIPGEQTKILYR